MNLLSVPMSGIWEERGTRPKDVDRDDERGAANVDDLSADAAADTSQ